MRRIYLTHCSREKDPNLESSGVAATPDRLYTHAGLQRFIDYSRRNGLEWAIFSDNYGVVFAHEKVNWYSKPPATVTEEEFDRLLDNLVNRLAGYEEIYFYHRSEDGHPVFERLTTLGRARGLNIRELTEETINSIK